MKYLIVGSVNHDIIYEVPQFSENGCVSHVSTAPEYMWGGKGANCALGLLNLNCSIKLISVATVEDHEDLYKCFGESNLKLGKISRRPEALIFRNLTGENQIYLNVGEVMEPSNWRFLLHENFNGFEFLIIQCEIPLEINLEICKRCHGKRILLDLGGCQNYSELSALIACVSIVSGNEGEMERLLKTGINIDSGICRLTTMGPRGAKCIGPGFNVEVSAFPLGDAVDSLACGDAFRAAFACMTGCKPLNYKVVEESMKFANIYASIVSQRFGTGPSIPLQEDLCDYFR